MPAPFLRPSTTSAPRGAEILLGEICEMRSPISSTQAFSKGGAPVPSINVTFLNSNALSAASAAKARELIAFLDLDAVSSARVADLPFGTQKRVELARALATQPRLLLADESLGGLDESEMNQAADMLAMIREKRGITIIWVEHIMGVLMRVVDRCVVLDHGEVIAEGKPAEIAHDPKVVEVYLGTDAEEVQQAVAGRAG